MSDEQNDETVLPINDAQHLQTYKEINDAITQLQRSLTRLADFAEMVGEPEPDEMRDLQRNTITCVHAFADATHQLARHRRRRHSHNMAAMEKIVRDDVEKPTRNHTHPSAATIDNAPANQLDRTGEYHDTDTPDEKSPFRYTDNK